MWDSRSSVLGLNLRVAVFMVQNNSFESFLKLKIMSIATALFLLSVLVADVVGASCGGPYANATDYAGYDLSDKVNVEVCTRPLHLRVQVP